jgi:hypothetical protein
MSLLSRLAVQAARAYGILSSRNTNVPADYLVIAGGGSGGQLSNSGGGGAGGFRTSAGTTGGGGSAESAITLSTLNTYSIVVGAGGAPQSTVNSNGYAGNNSSISGTGLTTLTSTGGGYGGNPSNVGGTGGSGGGSGYTYTSFGGSAAIPTQGNGGGRGAGSTSPSYSAGGGGGAGGAGGNGTGAVGGGIGGAGLASSISGSSVTYAGGGGGTNDTSTTQAGGSGGGGRGGAAGTINGVAGTANTGSGGGGGFTSGTSGAGGSGIVIISYTSATPKFVGGTITTSGGKQIHTFTSSGTLSPITPITASYLVVAGGGGGGRQYGGQGAAGGGGAGGLLTSSTTLYSGATYVVTVGAGGAGGSSAGAAPSGSNSELSGTGLTTITSVGGGGGAGSSGSGASGGSGGGGQGETAPKTGGSGTSGQGNAGGAGVNAGGGGGGASAAGTSAVLQVPGVGGAGTASSISGSSITYAGGGGGGAYGTNTGGAGGAGGGGQGQTGSSTTLATSGTANLGGGGGGAAYVATGNYNGAAGGSGVVIISYAGSQAFNGGLVTSSGGNTIHTFTSSGALTPLTNNLTNSLRFRSSASAYLNRTPASATNRKTWTWSGWVKIGQISTFKTLLNCSDGSGSNEVIIGIQANDTLQVYSYIGAYQLQLITTQLFRDPSAWYHIVVAVDTTQATSSNRCKVYVNGNQVTAFGTSTYPSQNYDTYINIVQGHSIGRDAAVGRYLDGYLADVNFIDGQALEPYYFGNNDANGVWKPILYKGTYGTNGFYLTFSDTSALTTSSNVGLGKDFSGNANYWATNNISITAGTTYDAMLDVPTNTSATVANYAVMNPLQVASATLSNANLSMARSATGYGETSSTFSPEGNKGYFEITRSSTGDHLAGFILNSVAPNIANYTASGCYWYQCDTGNVRYGTGGSTATLITGCTSAPTGSQIIMVAFDFTGSNRNVWFGLQGTWGVNASSQTGVPSTGAFPHLTTTQLTDVCRLYFSSGDANTFSINFGQRPFTYTAPSGFVALNTFNLPTPTILQGNKYMDATLWTGTGTTQVIVNQGQFKPDFVWIKSRSNTTNHTAYDSVRGFNASPGSPGLFPNLTDAEGSSTNTVSSANSNGFTIAGSSNSLNTNAYTFVGWQWQAGQGSTSSNTSGSITSTTSVSTTAGFSIVTYTGNGTSGATIGHGLGVAPKMIIVKSRSSAYGWSTYHASLGATYLLKLNTTAAATNVGVTGYWNNTAPTSTVFSIGNDAEVNLNTATFVAYLWAEIAGFSKFGSYTGNGSTDGPFVYLGFRPKYVMVKPTSTTGSWQIEDTSRSPTNVMDQRLFAEDSAAETVNGNGLIDYLSNGFKPRVNHPGNNGSGVTYIFMAFAENPFKNANAR